MCASVYVCVCCIRATLSLSFHWARTLHATLNEIVGGVVGVVFIHIFSRSRGRICARKWKNNMVSRKIRLQDLKVFMKANAFAGFHGYMRQSALEIWLYILPSNFFSPSFRIPDGDRIAAAHFHLLRVRLKDVRRNGKNVLNPSASRPTNAFDIFSIFFSTFFAVR